MALSIRAPLSALDDDDDDDGAGTASPFSSGGSAASSSPPSRSPSPAAASTRQRAVLLGAAPRVAAQISSSFTDEEEEGDDAFDDAADFGDELFHVARVPPPPPPPDEDEGPVSSGEEKPAAGGIATASESEHFGAAEGSSELGFVAARSVAVDVLDAGGGGVIAGDKGVGVDGSLDGSFQSSRSLLEADALADLMNLSDVPLMKDGEDVAAKAASNVVPEPFVGDAGRIDGGGIFSVDSSEGKVGGSGREVAESPPVVDSVEAYEASLVLPSDESDAEDTRPKHEVTELPPAVNSTEEEDGSPELDNGDSDANDITLKHGAVKYVEDASPEHADDDVSDAKDSPHSVSDGGHNKVDGETHGGHAASAYVPMSELNNAAELLGEELKDNVTASKGTHFGVYDLDDDQISDDGYDDDDYDDDDDDKEKFDGKDMNLDYAALAELLGVANRSPGQGKAKVFPAETNKGSTPVLEEVADPESDMTDEEKKLYRKVDMARIKYLRLVHRLGYDTEHQAPIQVLYRLSLVEGFRRVRIANHSTELEKAWKSALQLEAEGIEDLEFTCNILVIGKTGVGKSATINSIFGENRSKTNAFLPATSSVKEIAGVVGGVKFRVIDTPGLGTTVRDEKSNRKVLSSVKKYIKRCPPDIVLYVDRIDTQRQDTDDLSLLRSVTSVLGLSIWSKTIITLTHSAAAPPEGPSGSQMDYEMFVTHRTRALQQSIWQATKDPQIQNTVALVENHHLLRLNGEGEKVFPDGSIWRRELLLLCYSLKIVSEIDSLSTRRAPSASISGLPLRAPPLPYFLSSLLQSREHPRRANDQNIQSVDSDVDLDELLNRDQDDEEYDYNQLPPFKPLSKSQIAKISKEQQKLYFDEYDYRTMLLRKMQLKEQLKILKETKMSDGNNHDVPGDSDHPDDVHDTDRSPMPDWALPSSFDSDDPVYRYRCLEPTPNLLIRAVTNPEGWDHDCGFDGVSLQHSLDVANTFPASLWLQVNKDKKEFTIHLESSISAKHRGYASSLAGLDIQTMMDQLAYTLRGETKFKNFKKNTTTGGLSMTFLGDTMLTGAKFEDRLSVGNRLTMVANTGAVIMKGDTAYGMNMEATLREKDYPIGRSLATLGASLVRWHKEWTVAANLDSEFSVGRNSGMAVHLDMNNKLTGRVSIKANTSEQLKMALLGICSTTMYLWNWMHSCANPNYE